MKKRMKTLLVVFILPTLCLLTFTLPIHAATLYVATDGDNSDGSTWAKAYQTIQAAVNASTNGGVINVGSSDGHGDGTYTENVDVNRQVTIQSENGYATTTLISDSVIDDVFYVAHDASGSVILINVTIDGFTIYGAIGSSNAGIYLNNTKDCVIQNNRCGYDASYYNSYGIYLKNCSRNYIYNNICNNDGGNGYGIYLFDSDRNTISNNECKYNPQAGLSSYNSNSNMNTISNNTISNNDLRGITLSGSVANFILNNTVHSNGTGISLHTSANDNRIYLNSFDNTTNVNSSSTNYWRPGGNTALALSYFYSSANNKNYMGNYYDDYTASTSVDGIGTDPVYSTGDGNDDIRPLISDIDNYDLLVWYLNDDGDMYKDLPNKRPYYKTISSSKGSTIWKADEAAQVDLTFPSGIWRGQICIVDENGDAPTNGHSFTLEIGYSTNGTDFTAGPSATLAANGSKKVFEYITSSAAVSVNTDNYLALRITNSNTKKDYYAWTGGAWSYTTSPGNGDPNYSLPVELSVFTAQIINNTPTIYWSTQSETDNLGWYIYRNTEADFTTASRISGLIPGHGTTSQPQDYIYEDIDELVVYQTYNYWLESIDLGGTINHFDRMVSITIPDYNDPHQHITPPQVYDLRAEPNPFAEYTSFHFMLHKTAFAEVSVYNIKGELVKSYPAQHVTADETISLAWNGKSDNGKTLPVGIYLYRLQVNGRTEQTKRIILMR